MRSTKDKNKSMKGTKLRLELKIKYIRKKKYITKFSSHLRSIHWGKRIIKVLVIIFVELFFKDFFIFNI